MWIPLATDSRNFPVMSTSLGTNEFFVANICHSSLRIGDSLIYVPACSHSKISWTLHVIETKFTSIKTISFFLINHDLFPQFSMLFHHTTICPLNQSFWFLSGGFKINDRDWLFRQNWKNWRIFCHSSTSHRPNPYC